MKKISKIILIIFSLVLLIGCENSQVNKVDLYLSQIEVPKEVSYDFYLPRILNGEGDHIISWESEDEECLKISNITSITGLQYYLVKVVQEEKDKIISLKAFVECIDGSKGEKSFEVKILEDRSIKEAKIKYVQELLKKYKGMTVKESIKLPRVTEQYGLELVWKSNNEDVISSSGEYKYPKNDAQVQFNVNVLYNGDSIYEEVINMIVINKTTAEKELLLDFVSNFSIFGSNWDSSYCERVVDNVGLQLDNKFTVVFSRADKQAGTIVDRPVMAAKSSTEYITLDMNNNSIKYIEFSLTQWSTKTFDSIYIEYYDGSVWKKCSDVVTIPGVLASNINDENVNKVRLSFTTKTSKNVQMGLEYIKIELN